MGEPWRLRCPHGDTGWTTRAGGKDDPESPVYCETCQTQGRDPHYDHLVDVKTGERVVP